MKRKAENFVLLALFEVEFTNKDEEKLSHHDVFVEIIADDIVVVIINWWNFTQIVIEMIYQWLMFDTIT